MRLLVLAFVVSSLLRPSLVLCMESSGDVRIERQEAFCCDSEHASPDIEFVAKSGDGCDGCLDVEFATDSYFKRLTHSTPTLHTRAAMPELRDATGDGAHGRLPVAPCHRARHRALSSTVIRR